MRGAQWLLRGRLERLSVSVFRGSCDLLDMNLHQPKKCKTPADLKKWSAALARQQKKLKTQILVCSGPGCLARGSRTIAEAFRKELAAKKLDSKAVHKLTETGCHGLCQRGPLVTILPQNIFYVQVKPKDVSEIVGQTVMKGKVIERLLYTDPAKKEKCRDYRDIPFYARQVRVALRNSGTGATITGHCAARSAAAMPVCRQ